MNSSARRPGSSRFARAAAGAILPLLVLAVGLPARPAVSDDATPGGESRVPLAGVFACHESIASAVAGSPPLPVEKAQTLGISKTAMQAWRALGWWFSAVPPESAPDAGPREVYVDPAGDVRIGTRRVTVTLRGGVRGVAARSAFLKNEPEGRVLYASPDSPVVVSRVPLGRNPYEFAKALSARPGVSGVDVTTLALARGSASGCDDSTNGEKQWHLKADSGIDAGVRDAWDAFGVRGTGRVVAVIDFSFRIDHEDLAPDLGASRRFVEDARGAVIDVVELEPDDADPHGTLIAGVIGAKRGNGKGVCGVAPDAALRLISVQRGLSQESMWRAIAFARNPATEIEGHAGPGADVVSSSVHTTREGDVRPARRDRTTLPRRGAAVEAPSSSGRSPTPTSS